MKKRGFTLFELLVSISIIGILVAVASTSYGSAQKKARDARRAEDMNAIQKAAEVFYSLNRSVYPANSGEFTNVALGGVLQQWPVDPKGGSWPAYTYNPVAGGYCACARMDNTVSGNSTGACANFGSSGDYFCVKNQQ